MRPPASRLETTHSWLNGVWAYGQLTWLIWPRISPVLFLSVWMFTYVPPFSIASRCDAVRVTVPWRGEEQLRQRVLNAVPVALRIPLCRPATVGRPLRCVNVNVHWSVLPVSFAVKVPAAWLEVREGLTISWFFRSVARKCAVKMT